MRLIDGDALIEKFNEKVDMAKCLIDAKTAERFATFCALADAVEEMPTVDAVVVTRCKDCRYRGLICCPAIHETIGNGLVDCAVDNGYCWCGKPKET